MKFILIFFLMLAIGGCEQSESNDEQLKRNKVAWEACLNAGGIPIEAWYGQWALSDCKFPGDRK